MPKQKFINPKIHRNLSIAMSHKKIRTKEKKNPIQDFTRAHEVKKKNHVDFKETKKKECIPKHYPNLLIQKLPPLLNPLILHLRKYHFCKNENNEGVVIDVNW